MSLPNFGAKFEPTRARILSKIATSNPSGKECVIYWMCRDNRVQDNHAMLVRDYQSRSGDKPVVTVPLAQSYRSLLLFHLF